MWKVLRRFIHTLHTYNCCLFVCLFLVRNIDVLICCCFRIFHHFDFCLNFVVELCSRGCFTKNMQHLRRGSISVVVVRFSLFSCCFSILIKLCCCRCCVFCTSGNTNSHQFYTFILMYKYTRTYVALISLNVSFFSSNTITVKF